MTIEKVIELVKENCELAKVELTVPVKVNGKLTTTLGRVKFTRVNNKVAPTVIEFSRLFLETSTDESIISVVKHEVAHYVATMRTGAKHGHDTYFKSICHELGTDNDKTSTYVERTVAKENLYKYIVTCPNCGHWCGYHRAGAVVKNPDECICGKCDFYGLKVIKNW